MSEKSILYYVDIKCGLCSSFTTLVKKICKHTGAIFLIFIIKFHNFPCISSTDCFNITKIALGK